MTSVLGALILENQLRNHRNHIAPAASRLQSARTNLEERLLQKPDTVIPDYVLTSNSIRVDRIIPLERDRHGSTPRAITVDIDPSWGHTLVSAYVEITVPPIRAAIRRHASKYTTATTDARQEDEDDIDAHNNQRKSKHALRHHAGENVSHLTDLMDDSEADDEEDGRSDNGDSDADDLWGKRSHASVQNQPQRSSRRQDSEEHLFEVAWSPSLARDVVTSAQLQLVSKEAGPQTLGAPYVAYATEAATAWDSGSRRDGDMILQGRLEESDEDAQFVRARQATPFTCAVRLDIPALSSSVPLAWLPNLQLSLDLGYVDTLICKRTLTSERPTQKWEDIYAVCADTGIQVSDNDVKLKLILHFGNYTEQDLPLVSGWLDCTRQLRLSCPRLQCLVFPVTPPTITASTPFELPLSMLTGETKELLVLVRRKAHEDCNYHYRFTGVEPQVDPVLAIGLKRDDKFLIEMRSGQLARMITKGVPSSSMFCYPLVFATGTNPLAGEDLGDVDAQYSLVLQLQPNMDDCDVLVVQHGWQQWMLDFGSPETPTAVPHPTSYPLHPVPVAVAVPLPIQRLKKSTTKLKKRSQ